MRKTKLWQWLRSNRTPIVCTVACILGLALLSVSMKSCIDDFASKGGTRGLCIRVWCGGDYPDFQCKELGNE